MSREATDEAMTQTVMVCQVCGGPCYWPKGEYWYRSNAAGENLGGIFCSKKCHDTDASPSGFLPNDYWTGDGNTGAGLV